MNRDIIRGGNTKYYSRRDRTKEIEALYQRAFREFGTRALWNKRVLELPTLEDALVIARALRIEGNRDARHLAEQIERACRAAV